MMIALLLEVGMLACFGFSWPIACVKAYKGRTTKGISIVFASLILIGYALGIMYKVVSGPLNFVIIAYMLNFTMVFIFILIYLRNYKIDQQSENFNE